MSGAVNHPSHYNEGNIEVIDVIEDWELDFCLGNAVKYIGRAGKKEDPVLSPLEKEIEDLEKAAWYLNRRIEYLKKFNGSGLPATYNGTPMTEDEMLKAFKVKNLSEIPASTVEVRNIGIDNPDINCYNSQGVDYGGDVPNLGEYVNG